MEHIKRIAILFWFLAGPVFAQYNIEFSGYVVDLPIYQSTNKDLAQLFNIDQNSFLNLTRVRLRPTFCLWNNARINLEYEISGFYHGELGGFLIEQPEKTNRQLVDLTWNPINKKNYSLIHFIDRFYFRQGFDFGSVEIGRQRISWGTGRIWNPTDLFNPINPATYYKLEKDGADVISLRYIFGNFTDLNIVYNPQGKINNSNYGFRFRTNFDTYDFSLVGGYFDQRIVAGCDFAGNFFEAGVHGEGIISMNKNNISKNFAKFIIGADYQFTPLLYGLVEYHYNGEGKTNKFNYEFDRLLKGEILNLNRNYLAETISYQVTPLFTTSLTNITDLNDGSGYFSLTGNYSVTENFYMNAGTQFTFGDKFSEYWYYPSSFYLEGEFYF